MKIDLLQPIYGARTSDAHTPGAAIAPAAEQRSCDFACYRTAHSLLDDLEGSHKNMERKLRFVIVPPQPELKCRKRRNHHERRLRLKKNETKRNATEHPASTMLFKTETKRGMLQSILLRRKSARAALRKVHVQSAAW